MSRDSGRPVGGLLPAERIERARWRSRRGLLELELLLAPFARNRLPEVSPQLLDAFDRLLGYDDLDVHAWLLGRDVVPAEVVEIVAEIRRHLQLG